MPLLQSPTKMGEVLKGNPNRKTQTRKKKKGIIRCLKSSKQKKVDVNKLVSLAKKPVKKLKIPAANKEKSVSQGKKKNFLS